LIKDYDLTINYTPGKANVVADALSRKSTDTQPMNRELPKELLIQHMIDVIRDRLKITQSRQKSYADSKRRTWEPQVGDMVCLRVSPMKGVHHFGVKGKLSPRYTRPFKILSQIRGVAFELELPKDYLKSIMCFMLLNFASV
jgi:hypothetical protein